MSFFMSLWILSLFSIKRTAKLRFFFLTANFSAHFLLFYPTISPFFILSPQILVRFTLFRQQLHASRFLIWKTDLKLFIPLTFTVSLFVQETTFLLSPITISAKLSYAPTLKFSRFSLRLGRIAWRVTAKQNTVRDFTDVERVGT